MIGVAIARFHGFTYPLSCHSLIFILRLISKFSNKGQEKRNLHTFESQYYTNSILDYIKGNISKLYAQHFYYQI